MLTIIIAILIFAGLVVAHELGHFVMAKRNGVTVEEFGLGFPPRLVGKTWRGTLYSLNLLPLGGFVRMAEEDGQSDRPGTFAAATLWSKTKILLAGVVMNFVVGWFILLLLCLGGIPPLEGLSPSFVHSTYAQSPQLLLVDVEPGSPAAKAGLKDGDYVLAGNGSTFTTDDQLRAFTKAHAGQPVSLKVEQDGKVSTLHLTLRQANEQGQLGVADQAVSKLRYDLLGAIIAATWITGALIVATVVGFVVLIINLPVLVGGLAGSSVPAAAQSTAGPLGIFYIMSHLSSFDASYLWLFAANISVALGVINALPLPALDGGRWAVALVRRVSGGRISSRAEGIYHTVGFVALLGLVVIISVYDLRKYY